MSATETAVREVSGAPVLSSSPLSSSRLSTRRVFHWVVLVSLLGVTARPILVPDFWWHLRTGQWMVETRSIPHTDPFSYTAAGKAWVTHEWLSEVLIWELYRLAGWGGLILFFSLVIAAAWWLLDRRLEGQPFVAGFALLLGAFSTAPVWGVQPQMFTMLLASVFLGLLHSYARDGSGKRLLWMPPLMVLWVNLHGGFLAGPALVLVVAAGLALDELTDGHGWKPALRRTLPLVAAAAACLAVIPLNPNGTRLYAYPFETLQSEAMAANLRDWLSPDFHKASMLPFAALIFATASAMAISRRRARLSDVTLLAVTGWLALRSGRHIPLFALAATPLLAGHAWDWIRQQSWGRWLEQPETPLTATKRLMNATVLAVVIAACGLYFANVIASQPQAESEIFPRRAVQFLRREKPPTPMYHRYDWGGYLLWNLYPDYRSYIDGRADLYGDEFMMEYFRTYRGRPRWQETLERFEVKTAMVEPLSAIASLLRQDPNWTKVYEDDQAVVFVKRQ
ncbi:MAG TPA: hypothetical protein VLE48_01530 [Terriglobales bacterium]|nr:hypothetical protein [Terriglobales bacterium]